jgi:hypothetical protein
MPDGNATKSIFAGPIAGFIDVGQMAHPAALPPTDRLRGP